MLGVGVLIGDAVIEGRGRKAHTLGFFNARWVFVGFKRTDAELLSYKSLRTP